MPTPQKATTALKKDKNQNNNYLKKVESLFLDKIVSANGFHEEPFST